MSSLARPEMCNAMLLAPPGTGKAHPNDELILLPMNADMFVWVCSRWGDRVFDEHGEPVTVTGCVPSGYEA